MRRSSETNEDNSASVDNGMEVALSEYVSSGKMISQTITEVIRSLDVGEMRMVGPVSRAGDISSAIAKLNKERKVPVKISQSRLYPFHPASGLTLQNCYLLYRKE